MNEKGKRNIGEARAERDGVVADVGKAVALIVTLATNPATM